MRGLTDNEREQLVLGCGEPNPDEPECSAEEEEVCDLLEERGLGIWIDPPFDDGYYYFVTNSLGKLALELDTLARTKVDP